MTIERALCGGLCLAALLTPSRAAANGRFPATNHIVVAPKSPDTILLRTTYGLVLSKDHGKNWDWICEQAYSPSVALNTDPPVEVTGSSALLLAKFDGLVRSGDTGCGWKPDATLKNQYISDLVVRPDAPSEVLLVTSTYFTPDGGTDSGASYASQVYRSTDDGAQWSAVGAPIDPSWITETIEVAPSDPMRIYVSAARGFDASREGAIFVSMNGGQSWSQFSFPLDTKTETAPFVGAVDPKNPDRVYARTGGKPLITYPDGGVAPPPSRLLVSDDGGKTWKPVLVAPDQLQGFALSPDGATVYAGSTRLGLMRALATDLAFSQTSKIHVQCLRATANELWACSDDASGFVVGVSTDQGVSFDPRLHLDGLRAPLKCAPTSDTAICAQYFDPVCGLLGGCATPDGGPIKPPPPPTPVPANASSCGCDTTSANGATGAGLLALAIAAAMLRRRR